MLRTNCVNLGSLGAYGLLLLNATDLPLFTSDVIFPLLSILIFCTLIILKIGMKDIIKESKNLTES